MKNLLVVVAAVVWVAGVCWGFAGGDGTADSPWQIASQADLEAVNDDLTAHYILNNDIDLSGTIYHKAVIAPYTDNSSETFTGSFDGGGYVIRNLTIDTDINDCIGLFGGSEDCVIENIGIADCNVLGGHYVGGLVGENLYSIVSNCYSTGSVTGDGSVGGLVGNNMNGRITNCYSSSEVSSSFYVAGGLVGKNDYGCLVTNCFSTGDVSSINTVGGLMGYNGPGSCVTNCYSTGSVSGEDYVGGLVGTNEGMGIILTNCYSVGNISGVGDYVGGFCGRQWWSDYVMRNCFWDVETSGVTVGYVGNGEQPRIAASNVIGMTTDQMQTRGTFTDAGWDFAGESVNGTSQTWQIPAGGGYPELTFFSGDWPCQFAGEGTESSPYLVGDANDLGAICCYPNAYFRMIDDIDLEGIQWTIAVVPIFNGRFDGDGYVIRNMSIEGIHSLGLFGYLQSSAIVSDTAIEDCSVSGDYRYLGGLAGYSGGDSISNCNSTGTVNGNHVVGGLVGCNEDCIISDSYSAVNVNGDGTVGGLVGLNYNGSILDCYSVCTVTGDGEIGGLVGDNILGVIVSSFSSSNTSGEYNIGGLVGNNSYECVIMECYSAGIVDGNDYIGGLVGYNSESDVINCYSTGEVTGNYNVGGFCGYQRGDSFSYCEMKNCFWDVETSGMSVGYNLSPNSPGMVTNVAGKTTTQMQTESTFVDAGWDFDTPVWKMIREGEDYPRLEWQEEYAGDVAGLYGVDMVDLNMVAGQWGQTDCGSNEDCGGADIDMSGTVDIGDIVELASEWLEGF